MESSESLQEEKASKGGLFFPLVLLLLLFLPQLSITCHAQNGTEPEVEDTSAYMFVHYEEQAQFPGGIKAWRNFLKKHHMYPKRARRKDITGKVFLSFIVNEKGELSDIQVTRGIGAGCDKAAVKLLKKSPNWIPGKMRGKPVKMRMNIQIRFFNE